MNYCSSLHIRLREKLPPDSVESDKKVSGALLLELEVQLIEAEYVCPAVRRDHLIDCINLLNEYLPLNLYPERELRLLIRSARWCDKQGLQELAETIYQKLIVILDELKNPEILAQTLEELGDLFRKQGRFDEAVSYQKRAFDTAGRADLFNLQAHALNNMAVIAIETGNMEKAISQFEEALELLEKKAEPLLEGHIHNNLGVIKCIEGKFDAAGTEFYRALIFRAQSRDRCGFAETSHNIGMAAMDLDDYERAERYFDQALKVARSIDDKLLEGNILLSRAELFLKNLNPVIAGAVAIEAQAIHQQFNDPLGIADGLRIRGEAEMAQYREQSAETFLKKALDLNKKHMHVLGQAQCCDALCRLMHQTEDTAKTKGWAKQAVELWQQLGNQDAVLELNRFI